MLVELGASYNERILFNTNPFLFTFLQQGVGDVGNAFITDTYVILRNMGYFEHLIIYTLSGEGWLRSAGQDRILKKGEVWISPAGTSQEYGVFGDSWHILWFSLFPNKRWNIIAGVGTEVKVSTLGNRLLDIVNKIHDALDTEHFNTADEIEEFCKLILIYLDRELSQKSVLPKEREIKRNFEKLFMMVNLELDKPWNVQSLSDLMPHQYVQDYFVRLCKKYYGRPPMQVVKELRMQRSWELVCNTTLPIYEIAEKIGYTNAYAFSTTFKKYWNISPRDVRRYQSTTESFSHILHH